MRRFAFAAALALAGCAERGAMRISAVQVELATAAEPLRSMLTSQPELMRLLSPAAERRIQIVLGLVERGAGGEPVLRQVGFRSGAEYYYPASSIKFFAAIAALERLAQLRLDSGLAIDRDTALAFSPLFEGETVEDADPSHLDGGTITVGHEIRKLAIVSDNEAFNRLYELVGQDGLALSLAHAGLAEARIVHRLAEARSTEENRRAPRVDFLDSNFHYAIPERTAIALPPPRPIPGLLVGRGYLGVDGPVEVPMDFSGKNRITLVDLQRGLCKLVRPEVACGEGPPFRLTEDDRAFLLDAMSRLPSQSEDPRFDPAVHPDSAAKFLLTGLASAVPLDRLRLVSKYGQAYGFSTDNAWIEDRETGRGLFLAATIYTNADGILNDDRYDYDAVALPFFAELGRAVGKLLAADPHPKNR